MKNLFFITVFFLFSFAASAKTYVLKQGKHGGIHIGLSLTKEVEKRVRFDESAIYATSTPQNQGDINKLFGFSDCTSLHHKNSARFGWRWYQNQLELHAYNYVKKARFSKLLGTMDFNKSYDLKIRVEGDKYIFSVDGVETEMERGCSKKMAVGYKLYPYFGGDEKAPHDISIEVD